MAVHDRKKPTGPVSPEVAAAELAKVSAYKKMCGDLVALNSQPAAVAHTPTTLAILAKALEINPAVALWWGMRRRVLTTMLAAVGVVATRVQRHDAPDASTGATPEGENGEAALALLTGELQLTERIIAKWDAKAYPVWHHRQWTLSQPPAVAAWPRLLAADLTLCETLLSGPDGRNFHCLGHRHWCAARCPDAGRDAAAAARLLAINTANYSAFFLRAGLVPATPEAAVAEWEAHVVGSLFTDVGATGEGGGGESAAALYALLLLQRMDAAGRAQVAEAAGELAADSEGRWPAILRLAAGGAALGEEERAALLRKIAGSDPLRAGMYPALPGLLAAMVPALPT